jgi:hypothetical protein
MRLVKRHSAAPQSAKGRIAPQPDTRSWWQKAKDALHSWVWPPYALTPFGDPYPYECVLGIDWTEGGYEFMTSQTFTLPSGAVFTYHGLTIFEFLHNDNPLSDTDEIVCRFKTIEYHGRHWPAPAGTERGTVDHLAMHASVEPSEEQ